MTPYRPRYLSVTLVLACLLLTGLPQPTAAVPDPSERKPCMVLEKAQDPTALTMGSPSECEDDELLHTGGPLPPCTTTVEIHVPEENALVVDLTPVAGKAPSTLDHVTVAFGDETTHGPWQGWAVVNKTTGAWTLEADSDEATDGPGTLWAKGIQDGECETTPAKRAVRVDNHPRLGTTLPLKGDGIGGLVTLTGRAEDTSPGVRHVDLSIDNGPWRRAIVTPPNASSATWSLPWDSKEILDGRHTIRVDATDGRHSTRIEVGFFVVNEAPPAYRHPTNEPDEDANGVGDLFENAYILADPYADLDRDGLSNVDEFLWDTIPTPTVKFGNGGAILFPNAPDHDQDQWTDGAEAAYWGTTIDLGLGLSVPICPPPLQLESTQAPDGPPPRELDLQRDPLEDGGGSGDDGDPPPSCSGPTEGMRVAQPRPDLDTDEDGVPNMHDADSDNDGLLDGVEITIGTYPEHVDSDCAANCTGPVVDGARPSADPIDMPRLDPGSLAVWQFDADDARLGGTSDALGLHDATVLGAAVTEGRFGDAYAFTIGSRLEVPWPVLSLPQASAATWIKPDTTLSPGTTAPFLSSSSPTPDGIGLSYEDGALTFRLATNDGTWASVQYPVIIPAGEWHHVAGTYDGERLRLFYDGAPVGPVVPYTGTVRFGGNPLWIGAMADASYQGALDDVRLLARAFSAQMSLPAAPSLGDVYVQGSGANSENAVAAWNFDEDEAWRTWPNLLWDATGHGHDLDRFGVTPMVGKDATYGEAYNFTGGSRLSLPEALPITPDAFTFAAWVKRDTRPTGAPATIMSQNGFDPACGVTYGLFLNEANRPVLGIRPAGGAWTNVTSSLSIPRGVWKHVAASVGGTGLDGMNARVFVNGAEVASGLVTPPAAACASTFTVGRLEEGNVPLQTGTGSRSFGWYWYGALDDVRAYGLGHQADVISTFDDAPFDPAPLADGQGERTPKPAHVPEAQDVALHPYSVPVVRPVDDSPGAGDNLTDAEEHAYWTQRSDLDPDGRAWALDLDLDGAPNILDADSDGDGCRDGDEIRKSFTDPADVDCPPMDGPLAEVEAADPSNQDLPEELMHPANIAYLRNRTKDSENRAETVVEVNETEIFDTLTRDTDRSLNVATQGTPLNKPVRRTARQVLDLVRPDRLVSCARAASATLEDDAWDNATRTSEDPDHFVTLLDLVSPPSNASEIPDTIDNATATRKSTAATEARRLDCALSPVLDPVLSALERVPVQRITDAVRDALDTEAPDTALEDVTGIVDDTLDTVNKTLAGLLDDVTEAAIPVTDEVNATLALLDMERVESLHPQFLRDLACIRLNTESDPICVPSDLHETVLGPARQVEEATGLPLVETVDATHYNIAVWNGANWHPIVDLKVGTVNGIDANGDGTDDLVVTVRHDQNGLPVAGIPTTQYAPTVTIQRLGSNSLPAAVVAFLQHPQSPHVIMLGYNQTVAALGSGAGVPSSFSWTLKGASFDDGPPAIALSFGSSGGPVRPLAGVIPVNVTADGKPRVAGRALWLDVHAEAFPSRVDLAVSADATTPDTVDLRWTGASAKPVSVRFLDEGGAKRFAIQAIFSRPPAEVKVTKTVTKDAAGPNGATFALEAPAAIGGADVRVLDERTPDTKVTSFVASGLGSTWKFASDGGGLQVGDPAGELVPQLRLDIVEKGQGCVMPTQALHAAAVIDENRACWRLRLDGASGLIAHHDAAGLTFQVLAPPSVGSLGVVLRQPTLSLAADVVAVPGSIRASLTPDIVGSRSFTWNADGTVARVLLESARGGDTLRLDASGLGTLTAGLDAQAGTVSFGGEAVHLDLEIAAHGESPRMDGAHAAAVLDPAGSRLSVLLDALDDLALEASGAATHRAHLAAADAPVELRLRAPTGALAVAASGVPDVLDVLGRVTANGTHVLDVENGGVLGSLYAAGESGLRRFLLDLEGAPSEVHLEADAFGDAIRLASSGPLGSLDYAFADGTTSVPTPAAGEYVAFREKAGKTGIHARLVNTASFTADRDDASLRTQGAHARPLRLVFEQDADRLALDASSLASTTRFDLSEFQHAYAAAPGSTLASFRLTGSIHGRTYHWSGETFPAHVAATWGTATAPFALAIEHDGAEPLGGMGLLATTRACGSSAVCPPDLEMDADGIPGRLDASYDSAAGRLLVAASQDGTPTDVARLVLRYSPTGESIRTPVVPAGTSFAQIVDDGTALTVALDLTRFSDLVSEPGDGTTGARVQASGSAATLRLDHGHGPAAALKGTFQKTAGDLGFESVLGNGGAGAVLILRAAGPVRIPTLEHRQGARGLALEHASLPGTFDLAWAPTGAVTVAGDVPATLDARVRGADEEGPWMDEADDFVLVRLDTAPALALRLTSTKDAGFDPAVGASRHGNASAPGFLAVVVEPNAHHRFRAVPAPSDLDATWSLPAMGAFTADVTASGGMDRVELDVTRNGTVLVATLDEAPARASLARDLAPSFTFDSFGTGSVGRLDVHHTSQGEVLDGLGEQEGIALRAVPQNDTDPNEEGLSVHLTGVKAASARLTTDGSEFAVDRDASASAPAALFQSVGPVTSAEVSLSALPSHLATTLRNDAGGALVDHVTHGAVQDASFVLLAPRGFLDVFAESNTGFRLAQEAATYAGSLSAGMQHLEARATGAFGYTEISAESAPGALTWDLADDGATGRVESANGPVGRLEALLAPGRTYWANVPVPDCAPGACAVVDLTIEPPVARVSSDGFERTTWATTFRQAPSTSTTQSANDPTSRGASGTLARTSTSRQDAHVTVSDPHGGFHAYQTGTTGGVSGGATFEPEHARLEHAGEAGRPGGVSYDQDGTFGHFEAGATPASSVFDVAGREPTDVTFDADGGGSGVKVGLKVPTVPVLSFVAGTLPGGVDWRVERGDCGLAQRFYTSVQPRFGAMRDVELILTDDGMRPADEATGDVPEGLHALCDGGNVAYSLAIPELVRAITEKVQCGAQMVVPATSRDTPYVLTGAGGFITGTVRLPSGGDDVRVMVLPHGHLLNPHPYDLVGYARERTPASGIASWTLTYVQENWAENPALCPSLEDRPVEVATFEVGDAPGWFEVRMDGDENSEERKTFEIAAGGGVEYVDGNITLAPTSADPQPEDPKPFTLKAPIHLGYGRVVISDGQIYLAPDRTVDNRIVFLERDTSQGHPPQAEYEVDPAIFREFKIQGAEDIYLEWTPEDEESRIHLIYQGAQGSLGYVQEARNLTVTAEASNLPSLLDLDLRFFEGGLQGMMNNSESIDSLDVFVRKSGTSSCPGADESSDGPITANIDLDDLPPKSGDLGWDLYAMFGCQGRVGQVKILPPGGSTVGKIDVSGQSLGPVQRIRLEGARVRTEWDLDGDSRFGSCRDYFFLTTEGVRLTGGALELDSGMINLATQFKEPADLNNGGYFVDWQISWDGCTAAMAKQWGNPMRALVYGAYTAFTFNWQGCASDYEKDHARNVRLMVGAGARTLSAPQRQADERHPCEGYG